MFGVQQEDCSTNGETAVAVARPGAGNSQLTGVSRPETSQMTVDIGWQYTWRYSGAILAIYFSFEGEFTFQGLSPATGPHHHVQSEVWTNRHPASSESMSRQCETSSGSRSQQHRSKSVICRLFLQAPQWPGCAVRKQFSRDRCCRERSKPGCWMGSYPSLPPRTGSRKTQWPIYSVVAG